MFFEITSSVLASVSDLSHIQKVKMEFESLVLAI